MELLITPADVLLKHFQELMVFKASALDLEDGFPGVYIIGKDNLAYFNAQHGWIDALLHYTASDNKGTPRPI